MYLSGVNVRTFLSCLFVPDQMLPGNLSRKVCGGKGGCALFQVVHVTVEYHCGGGGGGLYIYFYISAGAEVGHVISEGSLSGVYCAQLAK